MRDIVPGKLWIGNAGDGNNVKYLLDIGVTAVIDLAFEERPLRLTRELIYCRFPLIDGAGNPPGKLRAVINLTASFIEQQLPTLVFCSAGMSRSPAILAAALAIVRSESLEVCLQDVIREQPHDVSPGLWADIISVVGS